MFCATNRVTAFYSVFDSLDHTHPLSIPSKSAPNKNKPNVATSPTIALVSIDSCLRLRYLRGRISQIVFSGFVFFDRI